MCPAPLPSDVALSARSLRVRTHGQASTSATGNGATPDSQGSAAFPQASSRLQYVKCFLVTYQDTNTSARARQVSQRVRVTDAPIIVKTKQFIAGNQDVLSLAQGALFAQLLISES